MKKFNTHAVTKAAKQFIDLCDKGKLSCDLHDDMLLRHIVGGSINDYEKIRLLDTVMQKYEHGISYEPLVDPIDELPSTKDQILSNVIVFKIDGDIVEAHLPFILDEEKFYAMILELKKYGFQYREEGVLKPYWWRIVKDETFFISIKSSQIFNDVGYYIDKSQFKSMLERIQKSQELEQKLLGMSAEVSSTISVPGLAHELYPFQKVSVEYSEHRDAILIADKMGLGKTVQAIAILQYKDIFPALIVVPANLRVNWRREFNNWLPDRKVHILRPDRKLRKADVYIISYGSMKTFSRGLKKVPFKSIVLDEAHLIKNEKAKRTKQILQFKYIKNRIAMTGTPILNRPYELIPQLDFLGVLNPVFAGRHNFVHRYAPPTSNGYWTDFGAANEEELQLELRKSCMIRREKEDVLKELPPKTRQIIFLPISNYKEYYAVERDSINWYKHKLEKTGEYTKSDIDVMAAKKKLDRQQKEAEGFEVEKLVRVSACKQAAAEYKFKEACTWIDNALEQIDKLVVFTYHRESVDRFMDKYSDQAVYLYGGMTNQTDKVIQKFKEDKNIKIFFGSILATSTGIDGLQGVCNHAAFFELGWNPSIHEQAEDRLHRIGQENNVNIYYLLGSGTIDEYIYDLIIEKGETIDKATNIEKIFDMIKNR